ncbi:hypothetical protein IFM89_011113 [Coptis chinensis]|uniref:ADP/ATP translocase n=1 Tax=Coptis chinensis TaxID=261450 RepID=A0A835H3K9_9MAGN|nr:hypothetical protein IFM89_011113 [Coptis chinensis]
MNGKILQKEFHEVTEQIEKALSYISFEKLDISEEVQEQVILLAKLIKKPDRADFEGEIFFKHRSLVIPDDFRCPISLELMKDPMIVSTGQTYERSCIQKWLDTGHITCPKTLQTLAGKSLAGVSAACRIHGDSFPASFQLGWGITIGAWHVSYPIDIVRRRMMMTLGEVLKYKSSFDAFSQIIKNEGAKSLFKGVGANILCAIASDGVGALVGYDKLQLIMYSNGVIIGLLNSLLVWQNMATKCRVSVLDN